MTQTTAETALLPAIAEPWSGTNLAGDIVENGIKKHSPEFQGDLAGWYRYSLDKKMSQAECATNLGVDGGTYSRVMRGEYKNEGGQFLPPPRRCSPGSASLRTQLRALTAEESKYRVMTQTGKEIHQSAARHGTTCRSPSFSGNSHIGKTENLLWFRDDNNPRRHESTSTCRRDGRSGSLPRVRTRTRAQPGCRHNKAPGRVLATIDKSNLVIVDEFHAITHSYRKARRSR